jgi:hypothetical protein
LTLTVPTGSSRAARCACSIDGVSTVAARPYDERAAAASPSSKDDTTRTAATGPKVSSRMTGHVVGAADEHGRRVPGAGAVGVTPAGEHAGAVRDGAADVVLDDLALAPVDERADLERAGLAHQRVEEGVGHRLVDVDPLDADADLAGVGERAERHLLRRPGRVDPGVDEAGVLAAALEHGVAPRSRPSRGGSRRR